MTAETHPGSLVLASASPRRRELLEGLGLEVEVRPAGVDEEVRRGESPHGHVVRLATAKVEAVARPGEIVIAADTVVVRDGEVLGKPADGADARAMLRSLSGRTHVVVSGVALHADGRTDTIVDRTQVVFAPLTDEVIDAYVATGEPSDKAGGYAIQGIAEVFATGINGSWSNVVGLPLAATNALLARTGRRLWP